MKMEDHALNHIELGIAATSALRSQGPGLAVEEQWPIRANCSPHQGESPTYARRIVLEDGDDYQRSEIGVNDFNLSDS